MPTLGPTILLDGPIEVSTILWRLNSWPISESVICKSKCNWHFFKVSSDQKKSSCKTEPINRRSFMGNKIILLIGTLQYMLASGHIRWALPNNCIQLILNLHLQLGPWKASLGDDCVRWWMSEVMNVWGDECLRRWTSEVMNVQGDECLILGRGDECLRWWMSGWWMLDNHFNTANW